MKHNKISILALCLSAFSLAATAQNVTVLKQGGVGHVYEIEQVDSVVYFPIGDAEQFPASEAENTTTLWDIIKAQPNLKKFAAILEAADYYTGKGKAPSGLHFSQLLSGSVPLSVYAPTDAAISEDKYAELMALAKTDGWKLQQEFLFNHISPQEKNEAGNDAVQMLNSKIVGLTSYSITAIDQECNSGKLFTMPSVIPYLPNLEEYLLCLAPDCSLAREFMVNYCATGTAFDAGNSISIPSKDGNIMVLDSVFSTHSRMMDQYLVYDDLMQVKGFGADLADENASYNMILPTDAVWSQAQAKLAPHYRYSPIYDDKIRGDMNSTSRLMIDNPDSISELSLGAGILVPLLGRTSSTQAAVLSNGIAYTDNEWSISASEYMPDVEVEVESADIFYNKESTKYKVGAETHHVSFDNDKYADITNMYGRVSNNNFYYLDPPGPTASPRVEIKLQDNSTSANVPNVQIMSGRYDIQIVVVPQWYVEIANGSDIDFLDEGKVDSAAAVNKYKFRTQISYNDGAAKDRTSTWVISNYDGFKVDTITIAADFEFPYSYKNIRRSYPTLILEGQTSKNDAKNGFIYSLCIDKIILKSKEDGSEFEVTP